MDNDGIDPPRTADRPLSAEASLVPPATARVTSSTPKSRSPALGAGGVLYPIQATTALSGGSSARRFCAAFAHPVIPWVVVPIPGTA